MVIRMILLVGPLYICFLVATSAATMDAVTQLKRIGVTPNHIVCFRQIWSQNNNALFSYGLLLYFTCLTCFLASACMVFVLERSILAGLLLFMFLSFLFLSSMTVPYIVIEKTTLRVGLSRSAVVCKNNLAYVLSSYGLVSLCLIPATMVSIDPVVGPALFIGSILLFCCLWNILSVVIFYEVRRDDFELQLHKPDSPLLLSKMNRIPVFLATLFLGILITTLVSMLDHYLSEGPKVLYSPVRYDGVGAQIGEMLMHHAYATKQKAKYGGTCIGLGKNMTSWNLETEKLIKDLGMDRALGFSCPPGGLHDPSVVPQYLPWMYNSVRLMDASWLETIQSMVHLPPKRANDVFKIVVHIRRGDITPCYGDQIHRYLPNSYYLDLIDDMIEKHGKPSKKKVEVVIHTQVYSFENLDVFRARNYAFAKAGSDWIENVNGEWAPWEKKEDKEQPSMLDVWQEFIEADVLIMSSSMFSIVPAILNKDGIKVYASNFFFNKLPQWEMPSPEILKRSKAEVKQLQQDQCETLTRFRDERSGVLFLLRHEMKDFFFPM